VVSGLSHKETFPRVLLSNQHILLNTTILHAGPKLIKLWFLRAIKNNQKESNVNVFALHDYNNKIYLSLMVMTVQIDKIKCKTYYMKLIAQPKSRIQFLHQRTYYSLPTTTDLLHIFRTLICKESWPIRANKYHQIKSWNWEICDITILSKTRNAKLMVFFHRYEYGQFEPLNKSIIIFNEYCEQFAFQVETRGFSRQIPHMVFFWEDASAATPIAALREVFFFLTDDIKRWRFVFVFFFYYLYL
jgi:hypothetical protein